MATCLGKKWDAMFLSLEELKQLTGYIRPTAQIRWLTERGYKYDVRADGAPVVLTDEIGKRLATKQFIKRIQPDLSKVV